MKIYCIHDLNSNKIIYVGKELCPPSMNEVDNVSFHAIFYNKNDAEKTLNIIKTSSNPMVKEPLKQYNLGIVECEVK